VECAHRCDNPHPVRSTLHRRGTLTRRFLQDHCATRMFSTSDNVPFPGFTKSRKESRRPIAPGRADKLVGQTRRRRQKMRAAKNKRSNKVRGPQEPQRKHTLICCSETSLGRLLTMILLSLLGAALAGTGFAPEPRAGLVFFWIPPIGAAAAGRPAERRGLERRRAPRRWAWVMSSRDWSSLPDIVMCYLRKCDEKLK
jgi:hypothetical protein